MPTFQEQLNKLNAELSAARADMMAKQASYEEAVKQVSLWTSNYNDCRSKRDERPAFPNRGCHIDTLNNYLREWKIWEAERDARLNILNAAISKIKQIESYIKDTQSQAQAALESDPNYQIQKQKIESEERKAAEEQRNKIIGYTIIGIIVIAGIVLVVKFLR